MKKLTALILTLSMLLSMLVIPMGASASEAWSAEKTAALDNRYTTVDTLNLPMDLFAKDEDFEAGGWYNTTSTATAPNALAYKGWAQNSNEKYYPTNINAYAFKTDALGSVAGMSNDNGIYTYTVGEVPFKLGTIAANAGEIGNNAYIVRSRFDATAISGDVTVNPVSTTAPAVYNGTNPVNDVTYTIDKEGISEVNLLMTDLYVKDASNSKLVSVYVKYEGESKEVPYYVIVTNAKAPFAKNVYAIKKADYDIIKANPDTADTMKTRDEYNAEKEAGLAEYKELVKKYVGETEAEAVTAIPSNWTTSNAVANTVWKALVAETKYEEVMALNPVTVDTLLDSVDESKFASIYQDVATVVPSASGEFVDVKMKSTWTSTYKSYVSKISVPVDSTKKVESIRISSNLTRPNEAILGGGGFNKIGDYNTDLGMLMLSYNGSNTITVEENGENVEYVMYTKLTRQCADTMLLGATITNAKTIADELAEFNEELNAIDVANIKSEECAALRERIAEFKTKSAYLEDSDFDTSKLVEAEERIAAEKAEADRIEALANRTYNYIDFSAQANIDAYMMAQDLGDKARFLHSASSVSLKTPWLEGNEATYTYTPDGATEAKTINLWIPETTHAGAPNKVTDDAYKKGLLIYSNVDTDGDNKKDAWLRNYPSHIYFMDQLIVDKTAGTNVAMNFYRFKGNSTTTTNKEYTEGKIVRTIAETKFTPDNVEQVVQSGDYYYSYIKNGDVMHKIGPMHKTAYSPNTLSLSQDTTMDDTVNVNANGSRLDLMFAVNNINSNYSSLLNKSQKGLYDSTGVAGTSGGYKAEPVAGFQQLTINYKDGSKETKYVLLRSTHLADYATSSYYKTKSETEYSFIYAPKYDDNGEEIVYDGSSVGAVDSKFKILNDENAAADGLYEAGVTEVPGAEAIKFFNKDIVVAEYGKLARTTQHRMDTSASYYGNEALVASILLDATKEVENVKFERNPDVAKNTLGTKLTDATNIAIVPAEIEGLSDQYVYYAYCGRLGDGNFLMSATLSTANKDKALRASQEILAAEAYVDAQEIVEKYIDGTVVKESDLTEEAKAKLEALKEAYENGFDISAIDVIDGVATVTFENVTGAAVSAIMIVAQYNENETELKDVKNYKVSFANGGTSLTQDVTVTEGNKVKIFIWKDLLNFNPYTKNIYSNEIKRH